MIDRALGLALLVPVLMGTAFSWTRLALEGSDVPADEDYAAVRGVLDAEGFDRAADGLAVLPPWSLRPLQALGDLDPLSGDGLASRPLHRHKRLFVVVEPDAARDHDPLVARLGPPAQRWQLGRVTLERFALHEPAVTFDFAARLDAAEVQLVSSSGAVPCDVPIAGGVQCRGKPEWQRVQRQWLLVSENGDRAVWTHPPPAGTRIELRFPDVPLGAALVVRAGHTRDGADRAKGTVRLQVRVGDALIGTLERRPAFGFATDVVDTRPYAGTRAAVTLAIDTDNDSFAHFAWDAYAIAAAGGAP